MPSIGVVVGEVPLLADVLQHLVFTLSGNGCIRKYHYEVLPQGVVVQALVDVVLQSYRQILHELSSWSDLVAIESPIDVLIY